LIYFLKYRLEIKSYKRYCHRAKTQPLAGIVDD